MNAFKVFFAPHSDLENDGNQFKILGPLFEALKSYLQKFFWDEHRRRLSHWLQTQSLSPSLARPGHVSVSGEFDEITEICYLSQQNIVRFDVPMDNLIFVQVGNALKIIYRCNTIHYYPTEFDS